MLQLNNIPNIDKAHNITLIEMYLVHRLVEIWTAKECMGCRL